MEAAGRLIHLGGINVDHPGVGGQGGPGQIKGLLRQSVIKRLNGGKEPLGDPLENILSNWSHMLTASMRNMAAVRALEAGQKIGIAEGVTAEGRTAEGAKVKGSVWVMQGGVKSHWVVHDPAVLEALESLSFNGYNNAVMRGAGMFKRMLTTTVTISPSFRARNLIRDTLQSIATAEVGFNPVKNIVDGIKIQRDDKLGVTLLAGGGRIRFGAINDGQQARHAKRLIELDQPLPLPSYEMVLKASHTFNLLDARRAISVTARQQYILRVRTLARSVAQAYLLARAKLGFPMATPDLRDEVLAKLEAAQ